MTSTEPKKQIPTGMQLMPMNPEFQANPYKLMGEVREADRVVHDDLTGRYLVGRFDDAHAIVNDRELGVDPRKANQNAFMQAMAARRREDREPSMLQLDPPDHTRLRALVSKAFTPRSVEAMRPRIYEIANALLDEVEGRASFDLMAAFCQPYPTIVIAEMLGVDPRDQAQFKVWSDAVVASGFNMMASEELRKAGDTASTELDAYLREVIANRKANPQDDLITRLVEAEDNGDFLNDTEVMRMISLLLLAGNLTTTDLLGNGMKNLLQHPEQVEMARSNPAIIPNAVEEMLRFEGPVMQTGRIVLDDREIAGCPMHKGDSVGVLIGAVNYDPRLHNDPEKFDITRDDFDHLAFGGGRRYCLGAPLARLEAAIGIETLLKRFPNLRLADQELVYKTVPVFRGLERLVVEV
jgi:hypothetical protein